MTANTEIHLAPPVAAMESFLEPHAAWIETVIGCKMQDALRFEVEIPSGELVLTELLDGLPFDRSCLAGADSLRPMVTRWAVPPYASPLIDIAPSRSRSALLTEKSLAWDLHWSDCPIGVWLQGIELGIVTVQIPFIAFRQGLFARSAGWAIINRSEAVSALKVLRQAIGRQKKFLRVFGGRNISLHSTEYKWRDVVMDPEVNQILRVDFETFLQREAWFRRHRFPFRRGYLLYGPPGNGKTTVIRVMSAHPALTPMTIDFSNEETGNAVLTDMFEAAGQQAPSLVILEDLDRVFGKENAGDNKSHVTFQHLLNCLDGLGSQDGVIVVATANNPKALDAAILQRPGRFDRAVHFPLPTEELRAAHLDRLSDGTLGRETIAWAAKRTEGFSFAQVRECYVLAGQLAFDRSDELVSDADLRAAIRYLRGESRTLGDRAHGHVPGFGEGSSPQNADGGENLATVGIRVGDGDGQPLSRRSA